MKSRAIPAIHSGVAACILDAMTDDAIVAATGATRTTVERAVADLKWTYGAKNRVALALALQREVWLEASSAG
jgi:predicted fused transcriptional regulator/phosphomethylpyrimidine kinase